MSNAENLNNFIPPLPPWLGETPTRTPESHPGVYAQAPGVSGQERTSSAGHRLARRVPVESSPQEQWTEADEAHYQRQLRIAAKAAKHEKSADRNKWLRRALIGSVVVAEVMGPIPRAMAKDSWASRIDSLATSHIKILSSAGDALSRLLGTSPNRDEFMPQINPTPHLDSKPTPATDPTVAEQLGPQTPQECIAAIPFPDKVMLNTVFPVSADGSYHINELTTLDETKRVIGEYNIGGVIVMGDPTEDPHRTISTYEELMRPGGGALIGIDQEGGIVKRIKNDMPSQQDVSNTMSPQQARQEMVKYYMDVKKVGVNAVFGPVLDKTYGAEKTKMEVSRLFEGDAYRIAEFGEAYMGAMKEAGILPFPKHLYGTGAFSEHTDTSAGASYTKSFPELDADGQLDMYRQLLGKIPNAMVGTSIVDKDSSGVSASDNVPMAMSPTVYKFIRDELQVPGILVTDDIGTRAMVDENGNPLTLREAIVRTLDAGGTPLIVNPANEADVLSFEDQVKQIAKHAQEAAEDGRLSQERLNDTTSRRFEALDIDPCVAYNEIQASAQGR